MAERSETREVLQHRLETQLREWSTRLDHLKADAERDMTDAELREQLYERLQKLRDAQRLAMEKLPSFAKASEGILRSSSL
jgi:hypothetical protein